MPYDNKSKRKMKSYGSHDTAHPIANKDTMNKYSGEMKDWRSKAKKD